MPTPIRNFRISDELWSPAQEQSQKAGVPLSLIVKIALQNFAQGGDVTVQAVEETVMPESIHDQAKDAFASLHI